MKKHIYIIFAFLLFLAGCGDSPIRGYYTFPEEGWNRFENPVIELEISKPGIFYDMWLEVHYDTTLGPDKFPLTTIMYSPSGEIRSRNLSLEFNQGDNNDGVLKVKFRKDYAFAEKGICKFEFENRTQRIKAPGILKIGVIMERAQ